MMRWSRWNGQVGSTQRVSFVHNDLKLDNCMFASGDPDRVVAFFDWDMTTIGDPLIDFGTLMNYWLTQNTAGRHVWPGMFTSRIDSSAKSWKVEEIINQMGLMRTNAAVTGHIHFSMVAIMENRQGISDQLKRAYPSAALPPATPWLGNDQLAAPQLRVKKASQTGDIFSIEILGATGDTTRQYAIWQRLKGQWKFTVLPVAANSTVAYSQSDALSGFIVTPIDRFGNAGAAATLSAADVAAAR